MLVHSIRRGIAKVPELARTSSQFSPHSQSGETTSREPEGIRTANYASVRNLRPQRGRPSSNSAGQAVCPADDCSKKDDYRRTPSLPSAFLSPSALERSHYVGQIRSSVAIESRA